MFDVENLALTYQQISYMFRPEKDSKLFRILAATGYGKIVRLEVGSFFQTDKGKLIKIQPKETDKSLPFFEPFIPYNDFKLRNETSLASLDVLTLLNLYQIDPTFAHAILESGSIKWEKEKFNFWKIFDYEIDDHYEFCIHFYSNVIQDVVLFPFSYVPKFAMFSAPTLIEGISLTNVQTVFDSLVQELLADFDN